MTRSSLLALTLAAVACGKPPQGTTDMPQTADMSIADLAGPQPDLTGSTADLTPPPPMLTGLPSGCPETYSATDLYTTEVSSKCAVSNCHGKDGIHFVLTGAADMKDKWNGKAAHQPDSMNYVTPGDIHKSYLLYKLMAQQNKVVPDPMTAGARMPIGGDPLPDASLCKFIAWIKSGAK